MAGARIQLKRGTAAAWTEADTVLYEGELGLETDTGLIKIGDGSTAWTSLDYFAGEGGGSTTLHGLNDVTITSASNGQVLKYNGSQWVNSTDSTAVNALDDIGDVVITSASNGQVLKYNGSQWINAEDSTGNTINAINDIGDVTITSVSEGEVLKYNGSAWVNAADSTGTSINALNDIGDVTITSVSNGQVLQWNGTAWVNAEATAAATTSIHPFAMLG